MADGFGRAFGGRGCLAAWLPAFHLSGFEGVTVLSNRPAGGPLGGIGRFIGVGGCCRWGSVSMVISSGFPVVPTAKSASSKRSPVVVSKVEYLTYEMELTAEFTVPVEANGGRGVVALDRLNRSRGW